jgi:hypothetical protein
MLCCHLLAQLWLSEPGDAGYGIRAGLSYQLGSQGNRVGLNIGAFGRSNDTEVFLALSAYRNFSHIETTQPGWEKQLTLGLTQGFGGKRKLAEEYDWSLASNNTDKKNSLSLYTTFYSDTYGTSQRVLGLGLNFGDFNLRFEDDFDPSRILGDYGDRYRTGALEVGYRIQGRTRVVAGFNAFTGDPEEGGVISPEEGALGRYGDYSLLKPDGTPVHARDRSIGNAYTGVRGLNFIPGDRTDLSRVFGLDNMQLRVGWSSEKIRQITQNKFHDLIANPQIPLRDAPEKLYFQFGTNHGQTLYP